MPTFPLAVLVLALAPAPHQVAGEQTLRARPASRPRTFRFAEGGATATLPFETDGGHIFLRGRVQGSEPVWLAIDTGASSSILDAAFARSLGLESAGVGMAEGPAGAVETAHLPRVEVALPGVDLTLANAQATPLEFLSRGCGRPVAGVLGHEFFDPFAIEIDYATRTLRLHDADTFAYAGPGEAIPVTMRMLHPYVRAEVDLGEGKACRGEFVIDLGSPASLMLTPEFAEANGLPAPAGSSLEERAGGVGGEFSMDVARVPALRLGPFAISRPVTLFPQGKVAAPGTAGNIGAGTLRRFRVIFDYARKRMILEPTPRLAEPDEYDMTGLRFACAGPEFGEIRVKRVSDGSPAAKAGLAPGDVLERVNGRPASDLGLAGLRELFRRHGTEVELAVRTGEALRNVILRLARRI